MMQSTSTLSQAEYKSLFVCILLLCVTLLISCSTTEGNANSDNYQDEVNQFFSDLLSYSGSVCVGVSGPFIDKEEAVQIAMEKCVQYLAYYKGLAVQMSQSTVMNSGSFRKNKVSTSSVAGTVDRIYEQVAKEMIIVNIQWYGGRVGAAVFATLPSMEKIEGIPKSFAIGDDVHIDGYSVTVVESDQIYSSLPDAIEASMYRASNSLLEMSSKNIVVNVNRTDASSDEFFNYAESIEGTRLNQFRAVGFGWNAQKNKIVCLAVSKD